MRLYESLVFIFVILLISNSNASCAQKIKSDEVKKQMKQIADWQIKHFKDLYSNQQEPHHERDWTNAALYVGMVKWAKIADSDYYFNWLKNIGEKQNWALHYSDYHADDMAVGQMYLDLYRKYNDTAMISPTQNHFDWIISHPSKQPITLDNYVHVERWTWCDALFMAPPVWARLANITGEEKYSKWMLAEYKATMDHLFDVNENLFYRDNSFIGMVDHGHKVFWSRGNGWVFAGLTLLMDEYQEGSEEYAYFSDLYLKMASRLIELQTPQGHWSMSLLAQDIYPTPETSGTAFFTFGLAWGINKGLLKKEKYEPFVRNGWLALVSHVTNEGMLGYVQPIGAEPGKAWPDKTEVYGTGAFLAAGSEVYKLYQKH